jgi:hypothetical protein
MAKSKTRTSRKVKPMPPESLAAHKKANDARVRQLVKTTRMHARMAKHVATLAGLSPKDIPASLKREMDAAHRAASGGKRPGLVRLKPTDPEATDPYLINPLGD